MPGLGHTLVHRHGLHLPDPGRAAHALSTGMGHAVNWRDSHSPDLGHASVHWHEQHRAGARPVLPLGRLLVQRPAVASAAPAALQDPDDACGGALPLPLPRRSTRRPVPAEVVGGRNLRREQQTTGWGLMCLSTCQPQTPTGRGLSMCWPQTPTLPPHSQGPLGLTPHRHTLLPT